MKKPVFIIAETFLSLVLAASLAAVAALAIDINTNGSLIPPELYGGKSESSTQTSEPDKTEQSSKTPQSSKAQESNGESSEKKQESSQDNKKEESTAAQQSSKQEASEESKSSSLGGLILEAPEGLDKQPEELASYIGDYGYSFDNLNFDHMVLVDGDSNSGAKVFCYQKDDNGYWWNIAGEGKPMTDKGYIGEKGSDFNVEPDSKKTPLGFYALGEGFYIGTKPDTTYPMFEITENTYWVDDPSSAFYNTRVEGTDRKDWSSADHMISAKDAYKYGIVVEYNTYNIDSELAGSIFMTCGSSPTEGSVAVPENTMKSILEWLDDSSSTYIYIVP